MKLLRRHLLPDPFDPLGQYPDRYRVQTRTRAFLVLAHAEVESFLEDWAKDLAKTAEKAWATKKRFARPLAYLVGTSERLHVAKDSTDSDIESRMEKLIGEVFPAYYKSVNENNGVKEANVLTLFGPLGVPVSAFGSILLPELNTFGKDRGDHAHKTSAVAFMLDPQTEYDRATRLLGELKGFDAWLTEHKTRIR